MTPRPISVGGCGNFSLEKDLGKPVVTSQAATLWHALTLLQIDEPVKGYGRLLTSASNPR